MPTSNALIACLCFTLSMQGMLEVTKKSPLETIFPLIETNKKSENSIRIRISIFTFFSRSDTMIDPLGKLVENKHAKRPTEEKWHLVIFTTCNRPIFHVY